jgi:hypothetical protein
MDFEKLALASGWRDTVFQALRLGLQFKYRLSGVLSISKRYGRLNG